jgi:hypothetical protein
LKCSNTRNGNKNEDGYGYRAVMTNVPTLPQFMAWSAFSICTSQ